MPKDEWKRYKAPWKEYRPRQFAKRSKQIMPFGKYRGKTLKRIPTHYLTWLLTLTDLNMELRARVMKQIAFRDNLKNPV